ncbi:Lipase 2 [Leucoagaricus sp. SymC.cos]|nr:Lipase 2 [Leucoagaricus sp. SymC.cos]
MLFGSYGAPQVKKGNTTLVGRDVTGLEQDFFGGIPFAEPSVGNLRLVVLPPLITSEDCLTINVFRPSNLDPNAKLPVVRVTNDFFGGGFLFGGSASLNGSVIVAKAVARGTPLIYVNFNYRLGPLGFPQGTEAANQRALNLAPKDELAALQWVQQNIGAFGGFLIDDAKLPTNVTVSGGSSGAIMTSILFLNSGLEKFARGAILESGFQASSTNFEPERRQGNWDSFVSGVPSCSSLATTGNTFDCLRKPEPNSTELFNGIETAISESPEEIPFDPTIDGPGGLYPDIPSELFARGQFARLPFIAGTNLDGGTVFVLLATINTEDQLRDFIIANFSPPIVPPAQLGAAADKLLQLYSDDPALGSPFNTGNNTFGMPNEFKRAAAIEGDLAFQSQRRFWQQTAANTGVVLPPLITSEDCLTINVFRPSNLDPNAKLPVLFWAFGGGFLFGGSASLNGSVIVAKAVARGTPLIYVNFNYRLGPLGFPQGTEAANQRALNLALKDDLAALQWVQQNIGVFGGDNVTVSGGSSGAIMTSILFLNSGLEKFARGAILESGFQASSTNFEPERRQGNWDSFVSGVPSCSSLATTGNTFDCLRKPEPNSTELFNGIETAISESPEEIPFDPTIDGPGGLYPDIPSELFARGQFARLPFIAGTNLDGGTVFVLLATINTEDQLRDFIIANFSPPIVPPAQLGAAADKLLQLYPDDPALGSPFNTGNNTLGMPNEFKRAAAIEGDLAFQSQRRFWQQTAANTGVRTWGYLFTQPQPELQPYFGSEISHTLSLLDQSSSSLQLSELMIDYWVSFATSLTPNDGKGPDRPQWEQYTLDNQRIIQLNGDNLIMIDDDYRKEQIDFINSVPMVFLHSRRLRY